MPASTELERWSRLVFLEMESLETMLLFSLQEHWLEMEKEKEAEEVIWLEGLQVNFCCLETVVWVSGTSTQSFMV